MPVLGPVLLDEWSSLMATKRQSSRLLQVISPTLVRSGETGRLSLISLEPLIAWFQKVRLKILPLRFDLGNSDVYTHSIILAVCMIYCILIVLLDSSFCKYNHSSSGLFSGLWTGNNFKNIKTVAYSLVGLFQAFWGWFSVCGESFVLRIKHLVYFGFNIRLLISFGLLRTYFRLVVLADFRSQLMVHTQYLPWDNTLKNKTVVPLLVPFFAVPDAFPFDHCLVCQFSLLSHLRL
jgi:hypothetical protein